MRLLDFLFGKPIKHFNEFFGWMIFHENKKEPVKSFYACEHYFEPSAKNIEVLINGDLSGPREVQIDFFKVIEENFFTISKSIIPLIEDEFGNWKEGFKVHNFQEEFDPICIQILRCENNPVVWKISFDTLYDENHAFTLTMSEFEAKEIGIDG